jgi:hypothetical protein
MGKMITVTLREHGQQSGLFGDPVITSAAEWAEQLLAADPPPPPRRARRPRAGWLPLTESRHKPARAPRSPAAWARRLLGG